MTPEQQKALALARARRRRQEAQGATGDGFNPTTEANQIEKVTGTGTFADMTGSGIAKAVPFGDEIASGLNAPFRAAREYFQGDGFDIGRAYDRNMQTEEELQKRREERSPVASTVGSVAGGIGATAPVAAGGLSFLNGAKPTLASMVGRGSAEGAAYGAAYGAGEGRGLNERVNNAVYGSTTGAITGGVMGAVGRIGAGKEAPVPSIDELRSAKSAAYDATDALGIQYKPDAYKNLVQDILTEAQGKKINPVRHPKAVSIIEDMVGDAKSGHAPSLRQLDEQRQVIYRDIGRDEAEQFFGNKIIGKIDDFIDNAQVGDTLTGDPTSAGSAVKQARELNRRYRNAQTIEEALSKAERRAKANNSGGNVENKVRQNLASVLDKKSTSRFLNKEEKDAIETVIRGTKGQNAARSIGNWMKGFGGHSVAGGSVVAAAMTGNPLPLAAAAVPYALGSGLKAVSRGMGNSNEKIAEALIRTGSKSSGAVEPVRKAIIDALTRGGAIAAPGYISR